MDELTFKLLQYFYTSIFLKISKKVNKNTNGDIYTYSILNEQNELKFLLWLFMFTLYNIIENDMNLLLIPCSIIRYFEKKISSPICHEG